MAKTRIINTKFWTDSYIQTLDEISKLVFLYLLTNTHTEICGVYEVSMKTIEFETGIDYNRLSIAFDRLSKDGKIFYYKGFVLIKNFAKHQQSNPKVTLGVQRSLRELPNDIKLAFCVIQGQNDRLYIDYDSLSHLNSNLNLNILSEDNTDESEPLKNQDIEIINPNESLVVEIDKEKSSAKKESYGNEDINRMLGTIKDLLFLNDFKETKAMQRNFGKHLVGLKNKLGKEEFATRFMELAQDEFHLKNMGSLKYIYNQIKGFVPIKKDTSNIATII